MSYLSSLKGIVISEDQLIFYYRALKPLFDGLRGLFSSWHLSQRQLMGSLPTRSYQTKLKQRFEALSPTVNELLGISGTAGASVGILHSDEVVCTADIGYRDVDKKTPPNQDTLYYIASLSKFMTAAGIERLVEDGKLKWTNLVAALPEFQHRDPHIRDHATIVDILSHRTGLAQKMHVGRAFSASSNGIRFHKRHVSLSNIYATRAAPTIPQRSPEGPNQPTSEFSAPV